MLPSTAIYNPPRLSEKSRREQKSLYPNYRGGNEFSILTGGSFTFKTVSPLVVTD